MAYPAPNRIRLRQTALLIAVAVATFALITWLGAQVADQPDDSGPRYATFSAPVGFDAQGQPILPYAALNPALVPALQGGYDRAPRAIAGLPPVGAYLPATGQTLLALPTPTTAPAIATALTATQAAASVTPGTPLPTKTLAPTRKPSPTLLPSLTPSVTIPPTFTAPVLTDPTRVALGMITAGPGTNYPPLGYGGPGCAPSGWPAPGTLTQYYHWYHRAIDLGMPVGTGLVATHSGKVIFAGWRTDGYGNLVIIENPPFITYYAHLSDIAVTEGQYVARGDVIGWSGSTGYSTGPHLHYEIRIDDVEVDPLTFEERGYPTC